MHAALQGRALMAPYLPRNGASGSPYSEGGALYALGLTYANHGHDVKDFLLHSLRETASEVLLLLALHLAEGTSWHAVLLSIALAVENSCGVLAGGNRRTAGKQEG